MSNVWKQLLQILSNVMVVYGEKTSLVSATLSCQVTEQLQFIFLRSRIDIENIISEFQKKMLCVYISVCEREKQR